MHRGAACRAGDAAGGARLVLVGVRWAFSARSSCSVVIIISAQLAFFTVGGALRACRRVGANTAGTHTVEGVCGEVARRTLCTWCSRVEIMVEHASMARSTVGDVCGSHGCIGTDRARAIAAERV